MVMSFTMCERLDVLVVGVPTDACIRCYGTDKLKFVCFSCQFVAKDPCSVSKRLLINFMAKSRTPQATGIHLLEICDS